MRSIIDVMEDVTKFIMGEKEESLLDLKRKTKTIGFSAEKPKRKYTRRKKTTTKRKAK
tara:strand:- start:674 stop:847 length:174 start_codon:yes stop_codon:yes gene_type:complete